MKRCKDQRAAQQSAARQHAGHSRRKRSSHRAPKIIAAAVAAVVVLSIAGGSYGAYAAGLAESNYRWFTDDPNATTYTLSTPGDVYSFAEIVNGTQPSTINNGEAFDFAGKTVQIAAGQNPSISDKPLADPTGVAGQLPLNVWGTHYEFEPIGTEEHPFQGTFNGNGASLLNMLIDTTAYGTKNLGLFGVIGEKGSAGNFTVTGDIKLGTDDTIENIGGVAGLCNGSLTNVVSQVNITIDSGYSPTSEPSGTTTPMNNLGGVVGQCTSSISACTYQNAKFTIRSDADAVNPTGMNATTIAKSIGGVVGLFGSYDHGTPGLSATNCANASDMYLCFTGSAGTDSWGVAIDAKPSNVGGIAGYASGSFYNCSNTGEVRTAARGADNGGNVNTRFDAASDNGASKCGGIVGSLRDDGIRVYAGNANGTTDNGSPSDVLVVENCWNKGLVIASDTVGGIAGGAGTYTLVKGCANGNSLADNANVMADQDSLPDMQGTVVSTRWNKPWTGGIAGTSLGSIAYCYNRAEVNNTQAGYYTAGICSGLGTEHFEHLSHIVDVGYDAEVFGCYNAGQIAPNHLWNNRYGALVGENFGYVHDCVVRRGSVTIGQSNESYPIGGNIWRHYDNISTLSSEELKTATATQTLNAQCFKSGDYSLYWFSGKGMAEGGTNYNDGFPVLTSWAEPLGGIPLDVSRLEEVSVKDAVFTNVQEPGNEPVPFVELLYYAVDGQVAQLKQNADYLIIPEEGAFDRSDEDELNPEPYKYSILGIGFYSGEILDFGNYGIGAGELESMTAVADSAQVFNWEVQYPEYVKVYDTAGQLLDTSNYSYIIYDSCTYNLTSPAAVKFKTFDSKGYVVFDDNPSDFVAALEAVPQINEADNRAFKVYDRDMVLIADSDANVYDDLGNVMSGTLVTKTRTNDAGKIESGQFLVGTAPFAYKDARSNSGWSNDGEAGFVVEIIGEGDYEGSSLTTQYNIAQPDIEQDCITTITMPDGEVWKNDNEKRIFTSIADTSSETPTQTFSAEPIRPSVEVEWMGKNLLQVPTVYAINGDDFVNASIKGEFRVQYGETSDTGLTPYLANRNATTSEANPNVAQVHILPSYLLAASSIVYTPFSGFIDFDFTITPADPSSIDVVISSEMAPQDASEGNPLISPVKLFLGERELVEDLDYEVRFLDATGQEAKDSLTTKGDYIAKVTLLSPNFEGQLDEDQYPFTVGEGKRFLVNAEERDESDYDNYPSLEYWKGRFNGRYVDDTEWTPEEMVPMLTFTDEEGNAIGEELVFGIDYEYVLSPAYQGAFGSTVLNEDNLYERNKLNPFIKGASLDVLKLFGKGTGRENPIRIQIRGLGEYAGCTDEVYWYLQRLDLEGTSASDWQWSIEDPVVDVKSSALTASATMREGWVSYKDNLVYYVTAAPVSGALQLFLIETNPSQVSVGQPVSYTFDPQGITVPYSPFSGKLTLSQEWIVQPRPIADLRITGTEPKYDGAQQTPLVEHAENYYSSPADFSVTYFNNIDAGIAECIATGNYELSMTGKYSGKQRLYFEIKPRELGSIENSLIVALPEQMTFTGDAIELENLIVTDNGLAEGADESRKHLVEGKDYTLSYAANTDVGTAHVYINGIGNYTGTIERTFQIVADESNVSYWVECVDVLNPSRNVQVPQRCDGNKAGDAVTVASPVIPGWHVVPLDADQVEQTIVLSATQRNAATFQYLKDGLSLPEDVDDITVDLTVYNTNWYAAAKASIQPSNADQTVEWGTSDTSVAQINSKGYIRAYTDGVVDITATSVRDPEKQASKKLVVVGQDAEEPFSKMSSSGVFMDGVPSGSHLVVQWESAPGVSVEDGKQLSAAYEVGLFASKYEDDENGKVVDTGKPDMETPLQPLGTVELRFPVPSGTDPSSLEVLHWDLERSTYETEDAVLSEDGKYLVVNTDHLSLFTITSATGSQGTVTPDPDNGNGGGGDPSAPGQGDDHNGGNTTPGSWGGSLGGALSDTASGLNGNGLASGTPYGGGSSLNDSSTGGTGLAAGDGSGSPEAASSSLNPLADTGFPVESAEIPSGEISEDAAFDWPGLVRNAVLVILVLAAAALVGLGAYWAYGRRPRRVTKR